MRIVIFPEKTNNVYTYNLVDNLREYYSTSRNKYIVEEFSYDSIQNGKVENYLISINNRISRNVLKIIKFYKISRHPMIKNADIINFHFISANKTKLLKFILARNKKVKLVASLWGSDFLNAKTKKLKKDEYLYNHANVITLNNTEVACEFDQYYKKKYSNKTRIVLFGVSNFHNIDALQKGGYVKADKQKVTVCVGTNSSRNQQHIEILKQIIDLPEELRNNLDIRIPLTYGSDKYREEINDFVEKNRISCSLITDWLDDKELATLRLDSDVLIQVQKTDMFSAAIQECLYAGNCLITGNWLPYGILKENDIEYWGIDNLNEIKEKLSYIINNLTAIKPRISENKTKIWKISSWERNIESWVKVYDDCL